MKIRFLISCSLKLLLFIIIFSCLSFHVTAKNLKIRIYSDKIIHTVSAQVVSGSYSIYLSKTNIIKIESDSSIVFTYKNNKINIHKGNRDLGSYTIMYIKATGFMNGIKLKPDNNKQLERIYDEGIILKIANNSIMLLNFIPLEQYIAGVVEGESGGSIQHNEYFKLQAIISRTYTLKNIRKHDKQGYSMCDLEHCQVFRGRCKNPQISLAVSQTEGDIIIDSNNEPINAAYHSNCGGQTVPSEDLWSHSLPYLKSVNDTFCVNTRRAKWEKLISKQEFEKYISKIYNNRSFDTIMKDSILSYTQLRRKKFLFDTIRLSTLRTGLNLKSTFFSIEQHGDSLLLKGRGFGHGVGLCQEGAMRMVNLGYSYKDIINHYYQNVKVLRYEEIKNNDIEK